MLSSVVLKPIRETAHMQLIRKCLAQSSQLTESLCTDPGMKSGTGVCELKKKGEGNKRHKWGLIHKKSSPDILMCEEKVTTVLNVYSILHTVHEQK